MGFHKSKDRKIIIINQKDKFYFNTVTGTTKQQTPSWFKTGLKFISKWISEGSNICEVVSFNEENNTATIKISTNYSEWTETDWNLQHTLHGFNTMDYRKLN